MAVLRANGPYIWVTWLPRLLAGENSCEWASWFRSQHESRSWEKVRDTFAQVEWQMRHTAGIIECRRQWEQQGYQVFTENQNAFMLQGRSATLGGKPDLVARKESSGVIVDVKSGKPSPSHTIQVLLYMYAVPRAVSLHRGVTFDGLVAYPDGQVDIPASALDAEFVQLMARLITRLGAATPPRRVPSGAECRYCNITSQDCPERLADERIATGGTEDF